jgi:hypothetical protein
MRRFLAGLACVAATIVTMPALTVPAHAQTKTTDPAAALKRRFVSGHGVSFTQTTRSNGETEARGNGVFEFDRSGVAASDITTKVVSANEGDPFATQNSYFTPVRTIWARGTAYASGDLYENALHPGEKWIRVSGGTPIAYGNVLAWYVNVIDPAALKTLLAGKKAGTRYTTTTTLGRLSKASPWLRAALGKLGSSLGKTKVSLKVDLGADGLPRRVVSSWKVGGLLTTSTETRFTGWGKKVAIKAPHGATVVDLPKIN